MKVKNKKTLIILSVLLIGVIGLTIAYFSNSSIFDNIFNTKPYGTKIVEEFISPDNWLPGDTTDKKIIATNTGKVDQAVRIKVKEVWKANNNSELNGWIHADGTKSNHETNEELETDERVAIINYLNSSDWIKEGDYYYYKYKLGPNKSTSDFIDSVTFNPITKQGDTCTTTVDNGIRTIECNSSGTSYDNATYKLTFEIETIQYNQYKNGWNTDVDILDSKPVTLLNHIMSKRNDASITNYTDGNTSEMYTFNHEATEQTPSLTDYRYIGDDPDNYVYFNCTDESDTYTCEVWRIIGVFEVDDGTGNFEKRVKLVRGSNIEDDMYWDEDGINDWEHSSLKKFLNIDYYNNIDEARGYGLSENAQNMVENSKFYLGTLLYNSETHYGTTEDIYSFERNINNQENVSTEWIGKIGLMYPSDQYMVYGKSVDDNCYNDPTQCTESYPWGIPNNPGNPTKGWISNSNNGSMFNEPWFISFEINYNESRAFLSGLRKYLTTLPSNNVKRGVRPTVYLNSNVYVIEGNGKQLSPYRITLNSNTKQSSNLYNNFKSYSFGEKVTYDNNDYYVIEDSDSNQGYVTLLKEKFLTVDEVNTYNGNYTSINGEYPYLENDNCNSSNTSKCTKKYTKSDVKKVIDNWSSKYGDDLVEVNGFKTRLLTEEIFLEKFGFERYYDSPNTYYRVGEDTLDWTYIDGKPYWSMTQYGDSSSVYGVGNNITQEKVYNKLYIRPVINLNKCALTGGCTVVEEDNTDTYDMGDSITYNNDDYYVISSGNDYVSLLKKKPLTYDEVNTYNNGYDIKNSNNIGLMRYYVSDNCKINSDNSIAVGDCSTNYNISNIKNVVDNWANAKIGDNLVSVNGYKSRLLTKNDLLGKFGYSYILDVSSYELSPTSNTPRWVYNNYYSYYTMSGYEDSNEFIYYVSNNGDSPIGTIYNDYYAIRPVINIKKCAFTGTC